MTVSDEDISCKKDDLLFYLHLDNLTITLIVRFNFII